MISFMNTCFGVRNLKWALGLDFRRQRFCRGLFVRISTGLCPIHPQDGIRLILSHKEDLKATCLEHFSRLGKLVQIVGKRAKTLIHLFPVYLC
jgi:hypothetical protein